MEPEAQVGLVGLVDQQQELEELGAQAELEGLGLQVLMVVLEQQEAKEGVVVGGERVEMGELVVQEPLGPTMVEQEQLVGLGAMEPPLAQEDSGEMEDRVVQKLEQDQMGLVPRVGLVEKVVSVMVGLVVWEGPLELDLHVPMGRMVLLIVVVVSKFIFNC